MPSCWGWVVGMCSCTASGNCHRISETTGMGICLSYGNYKNDLTPEPPFAIFSKWIVIERMKLAQERSDSREGEKEKQTLDDIVRLVNPADSEAVIQVHRSVYIHSFTKLFWTMFLSPIITRALTYAKENMKWLRFPPWASGTWRRDPWGL